MLLEQIKLIIFNVINAKYPGYLQSRLSIASSAKHSLPQTVQDEEQRVKKR